MKQLGLLDLLSLGFEESEAEAVVCSEDNIPPLNSDEWVMLSAPILEQIHATPAKAADIIDLFRYCFKFRGELISDPHYSGMFVVNSLAWLSINGKIEHDKAKNLWRVA